MLGPARTRVFTPTWPPSRPNPRLPDPDRLSTMIAEEKILHILEGCLRISQGALEEVRAGRGAREAGEELRGDFERLIQEIHAEKRNDSVLADQTWEWIWKLRPDISPLQIYGRVAWINYTILDLL